MKTYLQNILYILVGALIFFGASYLTQTVIEKASNNRYDQTFMTEFKQNFIEACSEEGNYAFCSCSYNYLQNELGDKKFVELAVKYEETQVLPEELLPAVSYCIDLY